MYSLNFLTTDDHLQFSKLFGYWGETFQLVKQQQQDKLATFFTKDDVNSLASSSMG